MNRQKVSGRIKELLSVKKKMELQDVPNYDYIRDIFGYYLMGDFDNMVMEIVKYPYGALDFDKCLKFYLINRYKNKMMINETYKTIINEYTKRVI